MSLKIGIDLGGTNIRAVLIAGKHSKHGFERVLSAFLLNWKNGQGLLSRAAIFMLPIIIRYPLSVKS